jgi:hypothetical protein
MTNGLYPDEAALAHVLKSAAHGGGGQGGGNNRLKRPEPADPFDKVDMILGSAIGLPFYLAAEKIYQYLPRTKGTNPVSAFYNAIADRQKESMMVKKHESGLNLMQNPFKNVPVLNKIVQNGWPVIYFSQGLTRLNEVYALVDEHGKETPFGVYMKGEKADIKDLKHQFGNLFNPEAQQKTIIEAQAVLNAKMEHCANRQADYAGCKEEISDGDISELSQPADFSSQFYKAELWLFSKRGQRTVIAEKNGMKLVKYSKPSPLDFLGFYSLMDATYTMVDLPFEPVERFFGTYGLNLAEMRNYGVEMGIAIKAAKGFYGGGGFELNGGSQGGGHGGH